MAQNYIAVKTKESVVKDTSHGYQEKWYNETKNFWYKADDGRFQAFAEAVTSDILRNHSNLFEETGIKAAKYWIETGNVHGKDCILSVSENFKKPNENLITSKRILEITYGSDLDKVFKRKSLEEKIKILVSTMEEQSGCNNFGKYFTALIEADSLVLNQDRHLNNIMLCEDGIGKYNGCTFFDFGDSFLLDLGCYRPDVNTKSYIKEAICKPFPTQFTRTVHKLRTMYGQQLRFSFSESDIDEIILRNLENYPKIFHSVLKERTKTILLTQQKKLF